MSEHLSEAWRIRRLVDKGEIEVINAVEQFLLIGFRQIEIGMPTFIRRHNDKLHITEIEAHLNLSHIVICVYDDHPEMAIAGATYFAAYPQSAFAKTNEKGLQNGN